MKFSYVFAILLILYGTVLVGADVISVNSGGSQNVAITPDKYNEGFFFPQVCGNNLVETGEQCDDGNTASGDGCSSTCQTEDTGGGDTGGGTGGGGGAGGGGGGGTVTPTQNIEVSPSQFNINLQINTNTQETVTVTNLESSELTLSISQSNLEGNILFSTDSLTIPAGESRTFDVTFVAPSDPGIITGKILVDGVEIPVSINVQTELLLFDSNIVVLNDNYQVPQGDDLETKVTLIPLGDDSRLDVTLDYEIKDYDGNVYLTKSETLLIDEQIDFRRDFDTGSLPLGEYIVGLELIYPNGVAPSSAHFEVIEKKFLSFGNLVIYLIIGILIIAILILIVLIQKILERRKERNLTGV